MYSYVRPKVESVGLCLVILCMNEFNTMKYAVLNFTLRWDNCVLVVIVRLDQQTLHVTWQMYKIQTYALHESWITICKHQGSIKW